MTSEAVIQLKDITTRFGRHLIHDGISLDLLRGEVLGLVGGSGSGKTTLLREMIGLLTPSAGEVRVFGHELGGASRKTQEALRRRWGVLFQHGALFSALSVFDNIALVMEVAGHKRSMINKKVGSVLRNVGMEERMNAFPPTLSGGEQQKITIARALAGDPKIILADEPTGSLDDESAEDVMNLLRASHERGTTVIIATHDKDLIRSTTAREIRLNHGLLQLDTGVAE